MLNAIFPPRGNGRANTTPNAASVAFARWTAADYADQQAHYVALREWYDGDQHVPLTDRQEEYLGIDSQFEWALNYLRLPVELIVERLTVDGFDGPEGIGGVGGLIDEWWTTNRMDGLQNQVHRAAVRDGDTYVLIEWDDDGGRPIFSHEPAYDGVEGMKVHYLSNLKRDMTMASKMWSENRFDERGHLQPVQRLNLYLPDVIEKYENTGGGWQPYRADGAAWPIPWPLGRIPVVHFRYRDNGGNWGESELEALIPLQMAINKAALDEMETADKTGAQLLTLTGATWPADAPNVRAGDVLSVSAADAAWGSVPPGDLSQLRERINDYIIRIAQIAHIPLQYFQVTGQIASAATQQADDSQLVAKVKSEAIALGNAWEDAMYTGLKLNELYGDGRDLARGENIECVWADFERVDPLALEERRAAIVRALVDAGLSVDGVLALPALGYTEEEQARMIQGDIVREGVTQ